MAGGGSEWGSLQDGAQSRDCSCQCGLGTLLPRKNQVSLKAGGGWAVEQAALNVCPRARSVILSLIDPCLSRT